MSDQPTLAQLRVYFQGCIDDGHIKDIPYSRSIMGQLADFSHQTHPYKGGTLYYLNAKTCRYESAQIVFEE